MKLNRDMIVGQAILLLQEEGIDAVSLRRVAARLDVQAPALARHVGSKDNLLSLMKARMFGEVLDSLPRHTDWQQWGIAFGEALWRHHCSTRDIAKLIAFAPPDEQSLALAMSAFRRHFAATGLPFEAGLRLQASIQALVSGWTGFATGSTADYIAAHLPIDETVRGSLRALVRGMAPDVAALSSPPAAIATPA